MQGPQQPLWLKPEDVSALPQGWQALPTEDVCIQLKPGKLFDTKTALPAGRVPVLNQSASGFIGYHDEAPGVEASRAHPVVTFANHTCELRLMRQPFSCIQNIFPKVGKPGVIDTEYFFYAAQGRVGLTDYKGHHPLFRQAIIPVPPLATQRRIASILGAYDDLIEVNRRRSAVLDEMARRLFEEWFVGFRVPGHQPPGASGVQNHQKPMPSGWESAKLVHVFNFRSGSTISSEERTSGEVPVYGANGIIGVTALPPTSTRCMVLGKIGSCGALHRADSAAFVTNNAYAVEPAVAAADFEFMAQTLRRVPWQQYVGGAANPYMPVKNFSHHEIALPPVALRAQFGHVVEPFTSLVRSLGEANLRLAASRDHLLPRLISGNLPIATAERELEAIA